MTRTIAPSVTRAFRALAISLTVVRVALLPLCLRLVALQSVAPVEDHFFPEVTRRPDWLLLAWAAPIVTNAIALSAPTIPAMRVAALVEVVASALLLIHQASYFYATWVVFFWGGTLLAWIAWSATTTPGRSREIGPFLAQTLIAFVFLGGAVGKWTAGYWSGELFDRMYFAGNSRSVLSLVGALAGDYRHIAAMWFSRGVVVIESAMVLVLFLPARAASIVSIVVACGLWSTSTDLYQVCIPLMGIAMAGRILASEPIGSELAAPRDARP